MKKTKQADIENVEIKNKKLYDFDMEDTQKGNKHLKKEGKKGNIQKDKKVKKKNKNKKPNKEIKAKKDSSNQIDNDNKQHRNLKILKWISIIVILFAGIIFAMISPIFNIVNIEVDGNNAVDYKNIIKLSGLNLGENIFRINKTEIKKNIKTNGYVNDVKIQRILPNKIKLTVEERIATYMFEYGNAYVYINNQGYILEVSNDKKALPEIKGISTPDEDFKEANRLNENDLTKLNEVLKIFSLAEVNNISSLITIIDISDNNEYKVYFDSENKTAYLGDCSNLETRMLFLTSILKNENGKAGEIFVNMNLNNENPFFREKVN